jgi:hypothetical protein
MNRHRGVALNVDHGAIDPTGPARPIQRPVAKVLLAGVAACVVVAVAVEGAPSVVDPASV